MRTTAMMFLSLSAVVILALHSYVLKSEPMVNVEISPTVEIRRLPFEFVTFTEIPVTRISAYNPVPRQTDGNPDISSCGPNLPRQIAVSRDLFFDENGRKHLCGRMASVITDRGEVFRDYVIWDTMNPRYSRTIDVMFDTRDESVAWSFGVTKGVLIMYD